MDLTIDEKKAIAKLKIISKEWPESLWIFATGGQLSVMKKRDGIRVMSPKGAVDQNYEVASLKIENDGGDW